MNAEKAKQILGMTMPEDIDPFRYGLAHGYLMALEKTRILEETLQSLIDENGDLKTIEIALSRWEKER